MDAHEGAAGLLPREGPWHAVAAAVLALPPHQPLEVDRLRVPHPRQCGFYASTGLDRRCRHHYRMALPDGRGLHVHTYRDRFVVHWDRVDPSVSVWRHFWHDVTRALGRSVRRIRMEAVSLATPPAPLAAAGTLATTAPAAGAAADPSLPAASPQG